MSREDKVYEDYRSLCNSTGREILPFKRPDVHLPNRFKVAKQRILGLRKRFLSNPEFHREYSSCLNDVKEGMQKRCLWNSHWADQ